MTQDKTVSISVHYAFDTTDEKVRKVGSEEEFRSSDFDTKVDVYEDRVQGWFLAFADELTEKAHADYVVLQITLAQVEGMQQFREGQSSERQSKKFFTRALNRMFDSIPDSALDTFYKAVRCGLFHDGFTKGAVFVSRDYTKPMEIDANSKILVNPTKFFQSVKQDFQDYVSKLRDSENTELRANFEEIWDEHWNTAKADLYCTKSIWPKAETDVSGSLS